MFTQWHLRVNLTIHKLIDDQTNILALNYSFTHLTNRCLTLRSISHSYIYSFVHSFSITYLYIRNMREFNETIDLRRESLLYRKRNLVRIIDIFSIWCPLIWNEREILQPTSLRCNA